MNKPHIALVFLISLMVSWQAVAEERKIKPEAVIFDIEQTVIKQQLAEGVTADDAIEALKSKAVEVNMKFVAHQPLSKELAARGVKSGRLEIFQFCNPMDANEMVKFNPIFAAYMPCRIALVEDQEGKIWLMMLNLNMLINSTPLPAELQKIAMKVNTNLTAILEAGATGDF
jgi:uncharacterized protein (DUF302 family)